ncbi:MAG: hypothetical protein LBI91_04655 [Spirochaetaceae bacterium]|jgi:hypothetical protein|nr:hypothetical protein [Spirochaetaceae bacterium]
MRVSAIIPPSQAALFVALALFSLSCAPDFPGRKAGEAAVVPPATPPLSRPVLGYGVIGVSYTRVTAEPSPAALSLGYFRRGSVVEVVERRSVSRGEFAESWVFVEGAYRGWLREDAVQIYDNEARAKTASESLAQ